MPHRFAALLDQLLTQPRLRPAWRALLALLLVVISYLAFSPAPPPSLDFGWDKLNHLSAFATLAFVAWHGAARPRTRWLWLPLALLGYGVLIELVQAQLPPREADPLDVLADACGLALGLTLVAALHAARRGAAALTRS